jgi:hypothetical protein
VNVFKSSADDEQLPQARLRHAVIAAGNSAELALFNLYITKKEAGSCFWDLGIG